jgi:hypothetical protein
MCPREGGAIVVHVASEPTKKGKEGENMNHFVEFDPYAIRDRNERIRQEVGTLRLEKQLHRHRQSRPGRGMVALVVRITLPLLRRAGIAVR